MRVSETCGSMEMAKEVALDLSTELAGDETNMRIVGGYFLVSASASFSNGPFVSIYKYFTPEEFLYLHFNAAMTTNKEDIHSFTVSPTQASTSGHNVALSLSLSLSLSLLWTM